jgi:O-antigen/teichoic acid export membrane protein
VSERAELRSARRAPAVIRLPFNLADRQSLGRKLIGATVGGAGVRVLGTAMSFFVGVQLARSLGPTGYGKYGTIMAVVSLLLVPAQWALPLLAVRDISVFTSQNARGEVKGVLVWFPLYILASSALVNALGVAGYWLWFGAQTPDWARLYIWGLVTVPVLALGNLGVGVLRGFQRVILSQSYDALIRPALFAVLLFIGIKFVGGFDAERAMEIQALAAAVSLGLCAINIWFVASPETRRAAPVRRDRASLMSAAPMTATTIIRAFDAQYAMILFGALAPVDDVGLFRVALSTVGFVGIPITLITLTVMPFLAHLQAGDDRRRLQSATNGAALAMFGGTLATTLAVIVAGEWALTLAFGKDYAGSWAPLALMACAHTIAGFYGSATMLLLMGGQERAVARVYAAGLIIGAALTVALYPGFGINSAGLAMIISELVKRTLMRKTALERISIDPSAIPILRSVWDFALCWLRVNKKTFAL